MTNKYEKQKLSEGYAHIIGCDEVGRGCLAGPVVAAAVILRPSIKYNVLGIRDSKLLTPKKREELSAIIKDIALAWSIAEVSSNEVDKINIHNASLLAMKKAVGGLKLTGKSFVYIDGKFPISDFHIEQEAVVGGDNKVLSIAAASIIAKVYRDELMQKLHKQFPIYNFAQHKGYASEHHREMIVQHGLSSIHRLTFCSNLAV